MKKILFLADLDHNLFQSHRVDPSAIHPMTVDKSGKSHCFATDAQKTLLSLFTENAFCVSVTARNPDQMMRVTGWSTSQSNDLALTDLGMTLLHRKDKGQWSPVPEWSNEYLNMAKGKSIGVQVDYSQLKDALANEFGESNSSISTHMTMCFESPETPYYFLIKVEQGLCDSPSSMEMREACDKFLKECQGDYFYHESEGVFAFWPTYISKEIAVQRLLESFGQDLGSKALNDASYEKGKIDLIVSSGDSLSDLGFMNAAHFWMTPSISQISSSIGINSVLTPLDYKD